MEKMQDRLVRDRGKAERRETKLSKEEVSVWVGGRERKAMREEWRGREWAELRGQRLAIRRRKRRGLAGARNKKGEGLVGRGEAREYGQEGERSPWAGGSRGSTAESAVLCGLLCVCHLEWYKL